MNIEQLKSEFLSRELSLKLYRELQPADFEARTKLVRDYAETVKNAFDTDVYTIQLNSLLGFLYLEGKQHQQAITHFEKALAYLNAEHYPSRYFLIVQVLSRCYRLLENYTEAHKWIDLAFTQSDLTLSRFEVLNILKEYADLLIASERPFNQAYLPMIESVINELGFPRFKGYQPIETILQLAQLNRKWNRELSKISLLPKEDKDILISEYQKYALACEIGWYTNYALEIMKDLKSRNK